MIRFNHFPLFGDVAPVWRAFDILDEIAGERLPDRLDMEMRADENEVRVVAMLPGLDRETISVEVDGDELHLQAERRSFEPQDARELRRERNRHAIDRRMHLPYEVESDQAEASYSDGVLRIRLPRAAASKPQRITVSQRPQIETK